MRFDQHSKTSGGFRPGDRARLWVLLGALLLVIVAMRHIGRPEFAERLERVFPSEETSAPDGFAAEEAPPTLIAPAEQDAETPPAPVEPAALADVQDNTYFRPAETGAWFDTLRKVRDTPDTTLRNGAMDRVSYAQLIQQPDVYRGRAVTLHGTALREEPIAARENDAGIDGYHRLWIAPDGGGRFPFVVYCLQLPETFPRGDRLHEPVVATGLFFKNWSYAYDGGMGLAPVVLARTVDWTPAPAKTSRQRGGPSGWQGAAAAIGVVAAALVLAGYLWRRTRRAQKPSTKSPPNWEGVEIQQGGVAERLAELAETDRQEEQP